MIKCPQLAYQQIPLEHARKRPYNWMCRMCTNYDKCGKDKERGKG